MHVLLMLPSSPAVSYYPFLHLKIKYADLNIIIFMMIFHRQDSQMLSSAISCFINHLLNDFIVPNIWLLFSSEEPCLL